MSIIPACPTGREVAELCKDFAPRADKGALFPRTSSQGHRP